jgi:hypothetical protein
LTDTPAVAVLPALSVQLADESPGIVPELHEATPERLSLPEAEKLTGWLYQSPESGPRESETLTDGGVASYIIGPKLAGELVFPALSVHVPENDAVVVSGPP